MSDRGAPTNVRSLEQRIRNLEGSDGLALRRRIGMALVVVGQLLPEGAVKGGSAMALRYGRGTRFTRDLDVARVQPLAVFRRDFEECAQKLHAVSGERSERARDLVDLHLLNKGEDLDLAQVAATCVRLFDYRRQHAWPPNVAVGAGWDTLYTEAAEGLDVPPTVEEAVTWVNDFVRRISDAREETA